MTQGPEEGLNTNTALTLCWRDLGKVCLAPKKERLEKRGLDLPHLDMETEALWLVS